MSKTMQHILNEEEAGRLSYIDEEGYRKVPKWGSAEYAYQAYVALLDYHKHAVHIKKEDDLIITRVTSLLRKAIRGRSY
jgi:hypothetical protein